MSQQTPIRFPVARVVSGNLYKGNDKDAEGKPLTVKTPGPDFGKPRLDYYFAIAIPKGAEQHWAATEWGAKLWAVGHAAFPNIASSPAFSWKVKDGDSQIPNKKGKKPCDQPGHPGHWVVGLSSGFAPKVAVLDSKGEAVWNSQEGLINPGDFVEAQATTSGNGSASQPGIYINHSAVCLRGYGERINTGVDLGSIGFGTAALPAGASLTPLAGAMPPAPPAAGGGTPPPPGAPVVANSPPVPTNAPVYAPPVPGAAVAPPVTAWPPAGWTPHPQAPGHFYQGQVVKTEAELRAMFPATPAVVAPPANVPPAPVPVVPHAGVLNVPPPPVANVAPPPVGPMLTAKAAAEQPGVTYEAFRAGGWSDDQMRAAGYIV